MLTSLRVENFAIVKTLELDFSAGMTAFTGETGAGKSIMIDALMLALGGRADASVVRLGEEKCDISACFTIDACSEPAAWLGEHEIACEEGELVLRRVIYAEGRSKSTINGQPFPLQKIRELSEMLVHIHGQHQHQTLMQHLTHRQQLDAFADHGDLLAEVQRHYKACQQLQQEMDSLLAQEGQQDRQELLAFQIEELNNAQLQEGELALLSTEHQYLHHAKDYLYCLDQMTQILQGEDQANICSGLHQLLQLLTELPKDSAKLQNVAELLNSALIQAEEASDELSQFANQIQLDPERLQEVESRLSELHQLGRKYQVNPEQLLAHVQQLETELKSLSQLESRKLELQTAIDKAEQAYQDAALRLRASRQKQALRLAEEISQHIQQLGMPKGRVDLAFTPLDKMQPHGLDKVEYLVCTNPGTLPDSLSKIASGGELSRISLAIQMITAQRGATPTLLFDEVDVGIGGATAALVGRLLRQLGQRLQVFCVTHQPQVASAAHHHFLVEKQSDQTQTFSTITPLTGKPKIDEIARMLGGLTINDQTRSHAQALIAEMV